MASETRSNAMRTVTLKNDTTSGYELHQRGKNPTLTLPYNPPPEAPVSLVSSAEMTAPLFQLPAKPWLWKPVLPYPPWRSCQLTFSPPTEPGSLATRGPGLSNLKIWQKSLASSYCDANPTL